MLLHNIHRGLQNPKKGHLSSCLPGVSLYNCRYDSRRVILSAFREETSKNFCEENTKKPHRRDTVIQTCNIKEEECEKTPHEFTKDKNEYGHSSSPQKTERKKMPADILPISKELLAHLENYITTASKDSGDTVAVQCKQLANFGATSCASNRQKLQYGQRRE